MDHNPIDHEILERPKDRLVGQLLIAGVCLVACLILLALRMVRANI